MEVSLAPDAVSDTFRLRFETSFIGGLDATLAGMGMSREELGRRMSETGEVRTIEVDGEEAGSVWTELRGRTLHLHALLLDEAYRGRGIGARILKLLEEEVAGRADEVELGVEDANLVARRLYEKAGFREARVLPEIGFRVLRKALDEVA